MIKFLKKFGYPCNLSVETKEHRVKMNPNIHWEHTVYLDNEEIDKFYSINFSGERKVYIRGFLKALGYKFR